MLLKTQMRRGWFALTLTAALLAAQALAPTAPAPLDRLELAVRDFAAAIRECTDHGSADPVIVGPGWRLTSTPLDWPAPRRSRPSGCRRV